MMHPTFNNGFDFKRSDRVKSFNNRIPELGSSPQTPVLNKFPIKKYNPNLRPS
jgi:hypothetical protein